jgi:diguanylate cyclase (GGDEF)-like protein
MRVFLACCLLFCLSPHGTAAETNANAPACTELTEQERLYVRQHPDVLMCVDPEWEPFERIDEQGRHVGIAADLLALVSRHTGLRFVLVPTRSWEESLAASKSGKCDILSFLNQSPEREKWLAFTQPLLKDPNVFITREEHPFIAEPENIAGETIALPTGTYVEERIRKDYPRIKVVRTGSETQSMDLVTSRQVDMTMRSLIVSAYTIRKQGYFNLKIAGQIPEYANRLRIGVRKDNPVLHAILDKGVRAVSPQEREGIISRHVAITVQMGVDRVLIGKILFGGGVLAAIGIYWTMRLRSLNKKLKFLAQTDNLTGQLNRSALDARLSAEVERAKRYGRPFSLLMFDIDRFKDINDRHGHLMGDKILVAMAEAAAAHIRATDIIGRWGGEEFLVLCPETDTVEALVVAERIRSGVEAARYPTEGVHTVSIGLAGLTEIDSADSLLNRADAALYVAKNNGRNQVRAG